MTTMKKFNELIKPLATKFHEVVEPSRLRVYYSQLYRHSEYELEQAVHRCEERCRHFPRIEDIERECKNK